MTALALDHLVIAVRDLDAASENYTRLLGRTPSWRGSHPSYGTTNVLYRIEGGYLELLAPLAEATDDSGWVRGLRERLDSAGEGLYALAFASDDIDATVAALRKKGLDVRDPAPGAGVDETTGARREWRNARIGSSTTRGVNAFIIQHDSPESALPVATPLAEDGSIAAAFDHTVLVSSHLEASLRLWRDAFGLDLRRTVERPGGRTLHFLRMGASILELAGETEPGEPAERDTLWGVAYRVDDLARTVERLRAAGAEVSDPRPGNAPGTQVADLKPGFSHDVRTLYIQKDSPQKESPQKEAPA
ncbi:MAG: VOC family protein [Chloroflexi bacterium]|nr:VOC family protein [Chloroflexota bacterium]